MSRKTTLLTGTTVSKQGKTGRVAGAVSGKPLGVDVEEAGLQGAIVGPVSATEAAALALSPPQRIAIEKMTSGDTLIDAADAAGVSRMTLYRWLKQDPRFAAAYNAWQQDVLATARGRLLALTDTAVTTVGNAMRSGDARAALVVLKAMGIMERPTPGPTEPDDVRRAQKIEEARANEKSILEGLEFGI